ncbi:AbiTii domain-containing protein [Sinorhizobium fredii]|uniref:AbiTii domain-containing protein n=1 Tax=Rhizobium fredii TaxID=380 RepID=UPI0035126D1E
MHVVAFSGSSAAKHERFDHGMQQWLFAPIADRAQIKTMHSAILPEENRLGHFLLLKRTAILRRKLFGSTTLALIDDIISSLTDTKEPVADVLRRCLVLAYKMKNEPLKHWVEKELNGYAIDEELPDYRKSFGTAKGLFFGSYGRQIKNQPLPSAVLKPEHREWARKINLLQPIAAYESSAKESNKNLVLEWPADLVAMYEMEFLQGFVLNRAWLEIPISMINGLLDTVRTRLLTFALEIQGALPEDTETAVAKIPPTEVDRLVKVVILGGNNVIGNVGEFKAPTVVAGDLGSLKTALTALGVQNEDIDDLKFILEHDAPKDDDSKPKTISEKALKWIGEAAKKSGKKGVEIGGAVLEEAIKRTVFGYLGH